MTVEDLLEELQEKLGTGEFSTHDSVEVMGANLYPRVPVSSIEKVSGDTVAITIDNLVCNDTHCSNDDEFREVDSEMEELEEAVEDLQARVKALREAIEKALKAPDARCTILEEALEEDED